MLHSGNWTWLFYLYSACFVKVLLYSFLKCADTAKANPVVSEHHLLDKHVTVTYTVWEYWLILKHGCFALLFCIFAVFIKLLMCASVCKLTLSNSVTRFFRPGLIYRCPSLSTDCPNGLLQGKSQPLFCDWHQSLACAAAWTTAPWALPFRFLCNGAQGTERPGFPHCLCWQHFRILCPSALWLCNPLWCTTHHTSLHHTHHHSTPLCGWRW